MKTKFEPLYTKDMQGNVLLWHIIVEGGYAQGADPSPYYEIQSGRIDGKLATYRTVIREGKNIGKANETTPYEQTCLDAESKWEKKKQQGYRTVHDLINADNQRLRDVMSTDDFIARYLPDNRLDENDLFKPMKCQQYYKDKEKTKVRIEFPCIGQPKINGYRGVADYVEGGEDLFSVKRVAFRSKNGIDLPLLAPIAHDLTIHFKEGLPYPLDGEIWTPRAKFLSEITEAVRGKGGKPSLLTEHLKFYVFDLATPDIEQLERLKLMETMFTNYQGNRIVPVMHQWIHNDEEAQKYTDYCISLGYEGAVFRHMEAYYGFGKRPATIVKLKRSIQDEFKIIDVETQPKRPELGLFVCENEDGEEFKVTPHGDEEKKKEYLRDRDILVGKWLTVTFYEWTKDKKPFHITEVTVRDYE